MFSLVLRFVIDPVLVEDIDVGCPLLTLLAVIDCFWPLLTPFWTLLTLLLLSLARSSSNQACTENEGMIDNGQKTRY